MPVPCAGSHHVTHSSLFLHTRVLPPSIPAPLATMETRSHRLEVGFSDSQKEFLHPTSHHRHNPHGSVRDKDSVPSPTGPSVLPEPSRPRSMAIRSGSAGPRGFISAAWPLIYGLRDAGEGKPLPVHSCSAVLLPVPSS